MEGSHTSTSGQHRAVLLEHTRAQMMVTFTGRITVGAATAGAAECVGARAAGLCSTHNIFKTNL